MTRIRAALMGGMAILFLVGVVAGNAEARDQKKYKGWGIVMARNVAESTLQIEGRTFAVTATTVFRDKDGGAMEFGAFPIFDVHQGLFAVDEATKVEYVARGTTRGWVLESVQLVDRLPN